MVIRLGKEDPATARRRRQGELLRKLRKINDDMSISEFAERIGVTPGAVSQWECGRFTPRLSMQVAIARALKVPHSAIFGVDAEVA